VNQNARCNSETLNFVYFIDLTSYNNIIIIIFIILVIMKHKVLHMK